MKKGSFLRLGNIFENSLIDLSKDMALKKLFDKIASSMRLCKLLLRHCLKRLKQAVVSGDLQTKKNLYCRQRYINS